MAQQIQPQQPRQEYQPSRQSQLQLQRGQQQPQVQEDQHQVQPQVQEGQQQVQPQVGYQPSITGQRVAEGQFEVGLSPTVRTALDNFGKVRQKAKWAAERTVKQGPQPQAGRVVQAFEDISDAAEMAENAIARNSTATTSFVQAFSTVASQHLQTLQSQAFGQQPHVTETVAAIQQALSAAQQVATELGQQPTGMTTPQLPPQQSPVQQRSGQRQPQGQQPRQQQPQNQQHQQLR